MTSLGLQKKRPQLTARTYLRRRRKVAASLRSSGSSGREQKRCEQVCSQMAKPDMSGFPDFRYSTYSSFKVFSAVKKFIFICLVIY